MTTIDNYTATDEIDDRQLMLASFLDAVQDTVRRHVETMNTPVFELEEIEKQAFLDKINPYLTFELSQNPGAKGLSLRVEGTGMMFILSEEGDLLGAEQVSHGDIVTGALDDVCVYPVPTAECLILSDGNNIPIVDESLSGVIMLKGVTYKTGLSQDGTFEVEHDLSAFQIGLPLAHYLRFQTSRS